MEHRNHILFISSWYPNRNNPTHGIFNKAFAEAAALYNRVSVIHVCSDEALTTDFEITESLEGNVRTFVVYYKKVRSLPLLAQIQKHRMLLRGFNLGYARLLSHAAQPDLIQLNVVMPAGIGAQHLSEKHGIPYVVNEGWSGYCPEDGSYRGFLMKFFTKKIIAKAKMVMPVSGHLKTAMLAHGLKGNYTIVPNVVNTALFLPVTTLPHSTTTFIHISTLDDSQKNVSGLLRAFAKALQQDASLELVIVGDGTQQPALRALAKQLQLEPHLRFMGRLLGQQLVDAIHNSDALVMFSNYETFCLTVAEALACGKPVITSRAGGLTDHIGAELGIMIDKKDEPALTQALLHFKETKSQFDPQRMRQFITDNFTVEKIGKQLTEIYRSVLSSPC